MTDPRVISIVSVLFAIMGSYSLYTGSRQLRDARRVGQPSRWFKNIAFLTGTEYIILTFVFLLSSANRQGTVPSAIQGLVLPLYFIMLIAAAVIAAMVIRQGIINTRMNRAARKKATGESTSTPSTGTEPVIAKLSLEANESSQREQAQRQRERRRKAAAARRRQAGKA